MNSSIHPRVYGLLLLAYPAEFRREYGPQMTQVFRDCCRDQLRQAGKFGLVRVWSHTLVDLIQTALKERMASVGKENSVMNNLRRDAVALFGSVAIIVVAFFALQYGRTNQVFSILMLGFILDAIVTAGVVGNFVVFLLAKVTKLNPLRSAFWTFLIISVLAVILSSIIGMRVDPQFNLAGVIVGYLVSFLFWYGLHWMWAQKGRGQVAA
jgi:hypothetical protein